MAESMMQRLRPLNLGGRRQTDAPTIPLPPTPDVPAPPSATASDAGSDAVSAFEVRSANVQRNPYDALADQRMPTVQTRRGADGQMIPLNPTPPPPFRLLAPSVMGDNTPPREAERPLSMWSEAPLAPPQPPRSPALSLTPRPQLRTAVSFDPSRDRRLTQEMRARPLHLSEYGRMVVQLLTMPWFTAPSGLAATVFAEGTPDEVVVSAASNINLLICGCEAFRNVSAGVLAVTGLDKLNLMLVRSGLSPIVPQIPPANWGPLMARQPPDFLIKGFASRPPPTDHEMSH